MVNYFLFLIYNLDKNKELIFITFRNELSGSRRSPGRTRWDAAPLNTAGGAALRRTPTQKTRCTFARSRKNGLRSRPGLGVYIALIKDYKSERLKNFANPL